jgi:hypothetical protein
MCSFLIDCKHANTNRGNIDTSKQASKVQGESPAADKDNLVGDNAETIKLQFGFIIKARYRGESGYTEVWHDNRKIFRDTIEEYKFDEKPYPMLNQVKPGTFELLMEFDNSPSKDLATFLRIENNKIVRNEQIPSFDTKPKTIDGLLTYHSVWDNGEMWNEDGKRYTTYNPEIYYQFTPDGLKLDTALTILKNNEVYGRFDGFTYKGTIGYPCDDRGKITDTTAKNVLRKPEN